MRGGDDRPRLRLHATLTNTGDRFAANCMELCAGGAWAAVGNIRGSVFVVELRDGEAVPPLHRKLHEQQITAMRAMRRGGLLFSGDRGGTVKLSSVGANRELRERAALPLGPTSVRGLAFSPNERKLLTAHDDKRLLLTDLEAGALEARLEGHGSDVLAVDWHPQLALVASGGKDGVLKLWDPRAGAALQHVIFHKAAVNAVRFHPARESLLASGGRDQAVQVTDLRLTREPVYLKSHAAAVLDLAWHPTEGQTLASCDAGGCVCLWALPCALPLDVGRARPDLHVARLAFAPDGRRLLALGNDRALRVWAVEPGV